MICANLDTLGSRIVGNVAALLRQLAITKQVMSINIKDINFKYIRVYICIANFRGVYMSSKSYRKEL